MNTYHVLGKFWEVEINEEKTPVFMEHILVEGKRINDKHKSFNISSVGKSATGLGDLKGLRTATEKVLFE